MEHDEWQQLSPACAQKIEEQKGAKADSGPDSPLLCERELPVAEAVQQCPDLPPLGFRYPNPCVQEAQADRHAVGAQGAQRCCLHGRELTSCHIASHLDFEHEDRQQFSPACARDGLEQQNVKTASNPDSHPMAEWEPPVADAVQQCSNLLPLGFRYPNPCVQEAQTDRRTAGAQGAQVVAQARRCPRGEEQASCPIASYFDLEHADWQQLSPACARDVLEPKVAKAGSSINRCARSGFQLHHQYPGGQLSGEPCALIEPPSQAWRCHFHHHHVHSHSTLDRDEAGGAEWPYSPNISTALCPSCCHLNCHCDYSRKHHCNYGQEARGQERRDCPETSTAFDHHPTQCRCRHFDDGPDLNRRPVPSGLQTIHGPGDGNCVLHAFCYALSLFEGIQCSAADLRQYVVNALWQQKPFLEQRLRQLLGFPPTHCQQCQVRDNSGWELDFPVAQGLVDFCLRTREVPANRACCLQELPVDLADYFAHAARQGSWLGPLEVQALAYITGFRVVLVAQLSKLSTVVFNKGAPRTVVLWHDGSHIDLVVPTDLHQGYPARFLSAFHAKHWWFRAGGGGLDEQAKAQVQAMIQQSLQQALASINWTEIISRAMPQQAPPAASQDVPMPQSNGSAEQGNEQPSGRRKRKKPGHAQTEQAAPASQQGSKVPRAKTEVSRSRVQRVEALRLSPRLLKVHRSLPRPMRKAKGKEVTETAGPRCKGRGKRPMPPLNCVRRTGLVLWAAFPTLLSSSMTSPRAPRSRRLSSPLRVRLPRSTRCCAALRSRTRCSLSFSRPGRMRNAFQGKSVTGWCSDKPLLPIAPPLAPVVLHRRPLASMPLQSRSVSQRTLFSI